MVIDVNTKEQIEVFSIPHDSYIGDKKFSEQSVSVMIGQAEGLLELIYKIKAEHYRKKYQEKKPQKGYALTVLNYMKNNLEKSINLDSLAKQVNLNKSYLVRLFKSTYGKTPINVLISLRMEKAYDLIINTNMSISEIAFECGFSSDSYFIAGYKKHFKETPLQTRVKNTQKNTN